MGDKKLGIIELLQRVGEDRIRLQFLMSSLSNIQTRKAGDVAITFMTAAEFMSPNDVAFEKPRNVGVVLWLPQEDVERATKEFDEAVSA